MRQLSLDEMMAIAGGIYRRRRSCSPRPPVCSPPPPPVCSPPPSCGGEEGNGNGGGNGNGNGNPPPT